MKFLVCPQCGISNFYLKNDIGERLLIKVSRDGKIIQNDEMLNSEGFNTEIIYCLGCSWSGPISRLKKYFLE